MERTDERQLRSISTAELIRHALEETKLLAKAEVLHAKRELKEDLGKAKTSGIFLGAAAVLALCALAALFVAVGIALPISDALGTALMAGVLLLVAGGLGLFGVKKLPKKPMAKTTERLKEDVALTKEQLQ